ncbi:MAG: MBL fold metallo-hydrolase [Deltaproteobacteria bacterium]|nr:MBL fold metallo-hydrolase [Deltaproteobacteria bacterium]MBW2017775.1 MBL fold metallo-hydrolase [Deltaproteobacteria bacterium]MBW2130507.1 MBL fold metallo-hydrolase [Deltaproteobacteria bacterium]MBW2304787.1 MBL fold metallo-hydrolase [Deltaproteobacteria bacterium]
MKIHGTGEIARGFYALGVAAVPVYLLDGPRPVLFDAGFAALGPLYVKEIKAVLGGRPLTRLFLTHAHWDHLGAAGYYKSVWPNMIVAGPSAIKETLRRPKALELVESLNRKAARDLEHWGVSLDSPCPFRSFVLDLPLNPPERIELSKDCHVEAVPTPGHTREHTSYWIPERRILIASEAVGCEHGGRIITEFLVDFDAYLNSLKNLIRLKPEILCLAHESIFTGPDAMDYLKRSLREAELFADEVEKMLMETGGDVEETVTRIKALQWEDLPYPKQPEAAYLINTRARVRHIRARLKRKRR